MVGWHRQLDGREFEQAPGADDRQGILVCCSPWGCKELDPTEWLNLTHKCSKIVFFILHHAFPYVNIKNCLIKAWVKTHLYFILFILFSLHLHFISLTQHNPELLTTLAIILRWPPFPLVFMINKRTQHYSFPSHPVTKMLLLPLPCRIRCGVKCN